MEPTFPLFRLPENVIFEVIKNFALDPLLEFSLISTKTKNIAASLGITARYVNITISHVVEVHVYFQNSFVSLIFYVDQVDEDGLIHLDSDKPISAYSLNERRTVRPSTPFSFNKWVDHMKTVFCYNKPPNVVFHPENERFEMESLKNAIKNLNQLVVFEENTEFRMKEILENFKNANQLSLGRNPFEDRCQIQEIFIQNFDCIMFYDDVSLDDMLSVNIEHAEFTQAISQKQFNRFLKHWIRGSNPRLQSLSLSVENTDSVNREVYLKGINCMEMSEETKRDICRNRIVPNNVELIQIRRKDGKTAVSGIKDLGDILKVRFIVQH